jgi:hypothetical protein
VILLYKREAAENFSVYVYYDDPRVHADVAVAVEFHRGEMVENASPRAFQTTAEIPKQFATSAR